MKRPVQLVVLVAMALLACQPLLAYASCFSQSCTEDACPPACCADMAQMPGMDHMDHGASLQAMTGCALFIEALPATSGCGQNAPAIAVISRQTGNALSASGDGPGTDTISAALPPVGLPPIRDAHSRPPSENRKLTDRGVLFQVFRI
jgi:hypothetical protein